MNQNLLRVSYFDPLPPGTLLSTTPHHRSCVSIKFLQFSLDFCNPLFCYSLIQQFVNCEHAWRELLFLIESIDLSINDVLYQCCTMHVTKPETSQANPFLIRWIRWIPPQSKISINIIKPTWIPMHRHISHANSRRLECVKVSQSGKSSCILCVGSSCESVDSNL